MGMLGVIGAVLVAVGGTFLLRLARWHRRRMRLLQHGMAVRGNIVERYIDNVEGKFYLKYSYLPRTETVPREREEQCTQAQWKRFHEGDAITVLYDPAHAETVGLYGLLANP
jgi:hypothetical protein